MMRPTDRSAIAVMASVALASLTLLPLTSDGSFVGLGWLLIGLIGGFSMALRRLRVGGSTVLATQSAIWVLFSLGLSQVTPGSGAPWYVHYAELWGAGIEHMRTQASPMDPNDGTRMIFVTIIGLIMIMTDLLVSGIHRPAWALAPPATLFLVPALGLGTDTGVGNFLLIALGYLAILVAEGLNTTARWTRGLSRDSAAGFDEAAPVVWRAAAYLAVPALVSTVVLGVGLPTLALPGFGFGTGGGNGPLQLTDPTLDLKRNLNQATDRTVIEYQSFASGGVYLKMASLPRLSSAGWSNVQIQLSSGNQLGDIPGLATEPSTRRSTEIKVLDFGSQYLPLPYATRSFEARGDWRYDPGSLVVINSDGPQELRGLDYTVESVDIEPSGPDLATVGVGTPADSDITAEIPQDLPQPLINEARRVVGDAETPAAKAAAIQSYLRGSRFTYSVDQQPGSSYQALENFLLDDYLGYCEQFASAMAMMARVAGIPSRVSVGFLPGERDGDFWKVSIRDMHAWPELYFANYGWVRFEPTPASVTGQAPPWSVQPDGNPTDGPTTDPSATASAQPSASAAPSELPQSPTTDPGATAGAGWGRTVLWSAIGLVALLILAAPATIRVRRRTLRLNGEGEAEEQVEGAWAEIRDTVVDHGGSWPNGSPRAIGQELATRLEHEEADSMSRVATLVERARYARTFSDTEAADQLPAVTQEIRRGIAAPSGPVRKILAVLLPRSLFPRLRRR